MRLLLTSFVTVILMGLPINALSQNRTKKSVLTNKDKSEILVGVITDSLNELMRDKNHLTNVLSRSKWEKDFADQY